MSNWEINSLNDERALDWLTRDYWSLAEGLALLGGLEMIGRGANPTPAPPFFIGNTGDIYTTVIRAIKSKSLKQIKPRPEEFPVYDFIQFAIDKRIGDWKYWRSLLLANPMPKKSKDWRTRPFKDFEAEKDQYGSFAKCAKMYGVSRPIYTKLYKDAELKVATGRIIKQK